jgi:uncharacterized protein YpmB
MKKTIIVISAIILAIVLVVIGCTACFTSNRASAYTRSAEGTIIEVTGEVVTVETVDGHVWEFEGEGFEVGQTVKVVFSNNGSPDFVKDDTIQWVG